LQAAGFSAYRKSKAILIQCLIISVAQNANMGLDRRTADVSTPHTIRNTHPVGLLCTSDQLVTQDATYTTHNKHNRWTSMPSTRFELAFPVFKETQT